MADIAKPMMPSIAANPVTFVAEVQHELSKVAWPRRASIIRMTIVVIAVSVGIGLYVGGLDLAFTKITDTLIKTN